MPTNLPEFTTAIASTVPLVRQRGVELHRRLAASLFRDFVFGTPVDRGEARGSWWIDHGDPRDEGDYQESLDPGGQSTFSRGVDEVGQIAFGETTWLGSNAPHIEVLEDGHSDQAPTGWVNAAVVRHTNLFP